MDPVKITSKYLLKKKPVENRHNKIHKIRSVEFYYTNQAKSIVHRYTKVRVHICLAVCLPQFSHCMMGYEDAFLSRIGIRKQ